MIGISNDKTNFSHKLLLKDTQVSKIGKAFAKGSSANTKFSKTRSSKMRQPGEYLTYTTEIMTGLNNLVEFQFKELNSYKTESSNTDTKKLNKINSIAARIYLIDKTLKENLVQ